MVIVQQFISIQYNIYTVLMCNFYYIPLYCIIVKYHTYPQLNVCECAQRDSTGPNSGSYAASYVLIIQSGPWNETKYALIVDFQL